MREGNLNVQIYSSCNCSCDFCVFTDKKGTKINPDFVINYLNDHPDITYVLLTGGEPTFAMDVCQKILRDAPKNIHYVIQTNGWWGNNDNIKRMFEETPPTEVHLSVDYEKQKNVPLETVVAAYEFLQTLPIVTNVVNHTKSEEEFQHYKSIFPKIFRGKVLHDDGRLYDCGTALLATNEVSTLNIKGWGGQHDG
jgi:MoaA/NifB/PqqE/SkfB family radical SAM enzyme